MMHFIRRKGQPARKHMIYMQNDHKNLSDAIPHLKNRSKLCIPCLIKDPDFPPNVNLAELTVNIKNSRNLFVFTIWR